jgi:hypothetical protein
MESPYKTKKYHYNYRHPEELTESNLRKTFSNVCSTAFVENRDKTIRAELLNHDTMNSKEREEAMFKMKHELEKMAQMPDDNESFFTKIDDNSALRQQFKVWKKNMYVPLRE